MNEESKVREVLSRYLRATDERDGVKQSSLFAEEGILQIYFLTESRKYEPLGSVLVGRQAICDAMPDFMAAHVGGAPSHHMTTDHIIDIDGDTAHMNAQFFAFEVIADPTPQSDPADASRGVRGHLQLYASGYYDMDLRLIGDEWKIVHNRVLADLSPPQTPGANGASEGPISS
jgi:hypothetical protein